MTLSRDALAELALATYGGDWQTRLARERGVAVRIVQRWAKDGIAEPRTAHAISAFLRSRRLVSIAPPLDADGQPCRGSAFGPALADLLDGALAAGWTEADALRGMAGWIADAGRRAAA